MKLFFPAAKTKLFLFFYTKTTVYISHTLPALLISAQAFLRLLLLPLIHFLVPSNNYDIYPVPADIS